MKIGPFKYIIIIFVLLIAIVVGNRLDTALFPKKPCPQFLTITIATVNNQAQASALTAHRLDDCYVQWVNLTGSAFHLKFKDEPGDPNDNLGPLAAGMIEIEVLPNTPTGFYQIADRTAEHGKQIYFKYHSTSTPLSGPPGEPGMTVED